MKTKVRLPRVKEAPTMGVAEFKRRCLALLDGVATSGNEYVITKHGVPIALVSPIRQEGDTLRGRFKGRAEARGDLVNFDSTLDWEANR